MLPRINLIDCKEARYMLFNTSDAISNVLYKSGQWEEYLLAISRVIIDGNEAPIVFDIGANLGAYSIPLAKSIQSRGGMVYGYEPQRIIYYQLCGNIILNRLDNYEALNFAIGEEVGFIDIPSIDYENNHNIGAFSLSNDFRKGLDVEKYCNYNKSISTRMITLDSVQLSKAPALIKIDVEGYELNVLKGGTNFLEQHHYPPLMFEAWNAPWFTESKIELLSFCERIGYDISFNIGDEYIAQHPSNAVRIDFNKASDGSITMVRSR